MNEDSQVFEDSQYQDDGSELELSEDDGDDEHEASDSMGDGNGGEMVPGETGEGGAKIEDPNPPPNLDEIGQMVEHQEVDWDEIPPSQPLPFDMIEIIDTPTKDTEPKENENEVPNAPSSSKETFVRKRSDVEGQISELTKKMNDAKKLLTSQ